MECKLTQLYYASHCAGYSRGHAMPGVTYNTTQHTEEEEASQLVCFFSRQKGKLPQKLLGSLMSLTRMVESAQPSANDWHK